MANHLPSGFKFLPTDVELIDFYLRKRLEGSLQENSLITELNVYDCHPEMLLAIYVEGNEEGYFFTKRVRKYDKGKVVNRVAGDGFWKMTSPEKVVRRNSDGCPIGKKHVLKYFGGTPSKKESTDWIMHEYEMAGDRDEFQDVVLCKIYSKGGKKVENRVIDFEVGLEDESRSLQQSSHASAEATNDAQWNFGDDNEMLDIELILKTLT